MIIIGFVIGFWSTVRCNFLNIYDEGWERLRVCDISLFALGQWGKKSRVELQRIKNLYGKGREARAWLELCTRVRWKQS